MISHFRDKQAEAQRGEVAGKVTTSVWNFQLPACRFPPNPGLCIFASPAAHLGWEVSVVGGEEARGWASFFLLLHHQQPELPTPGE